MSLISLQKATLLSGVTANTTGTSKQTERAKGWTFSVDGSGSADATVSIEAYVGTSWYVIHEEVITGDGSFMVRDDEGHYEAMRARVSSYSSGTFSVYATGTTNSL
mgnify:CR=1 FL=1